MGDPVLAPRQPHRRVGVVAGARAGQLGVRAARVAASSRDLQARLAARGHPVGDLRANTSRAPRRRLGRGGRRGRLRRQREIRASRPPITLDATVNPDFSQVESDAFQVEVNQRFPVFFSEKRPFFMEGAGIFTLAGEGNDNSLQRAVHTRRIVDPIFGAKLTGSVGRVSVRHADRARSGRRPQSAETAIRTTARIALVQHRARAVQPRAAATTSGALVARRRVRGRVQPRRSARDLSWRVNSTQRVSGFVLASRHARSARGGVDDRHRRAARATSISTRRLVLVGYGEHYDRDFEMQTAFINRVGITSGWGFGGIQLLSRQEEVSVAAAASRRSRSRRAGAIATPAATSCSQVTGDHGSASRRRASCASIASTASRPGRASGSIAATGAARAACSSIAGCLLNAQLMTGAAVFYDPDEPFQGRIARLPASDSPCSRAAGSRRRSTTGASRSIASPTGEQRLRPRHRLQPHHVSVLAPVLRPRDRRSTTARAISVLTDFLASYELRPGTVVYAGYGSLIEQRDFDRTASGCSAAATYQTSQRGLFFKASYLHRF